MEQHWNWHMESSGIRSGEYWYVLWKVLVVCVCWVPAVESSGMQEEELMEPMTAKLSLACGKHASRVQVSADRQYSNISSRCTGTYVGAEEILQDCCLEIWSYSQGSGFDLNHLPSLNVSTGPEISPQ
jgi:hypothetical protein